MTPRFFTTKRWNWFFAIYVVRLALSVCLKNICDGVGGQDESNVTHLDPPLFWLDNIFKEMVQLKPVRSFGQTIEDPWPRHTVDCHCNTPIPDIKEKNTVFNVLQNRSLQFFRTRRHHSSLIHICQFRYASVSGFNMGHNFLLLKGLCHEMNNFLEGTG